jgi:1-deoxy-D-xylulose-5-phosphate synthase
MPDGTGLIEFGKVFPERYFDVGICEQHAVGFAAGLAHAGMRPVAAIYSTFLQRAYDSVFQEVCIQNLPVVFAMDRGGIAGNDGPTHNGLFDIAYLRTLPNIVLLSPKDGDELARMLEFMLSLRGPSAIRYPRGNVPDFSAYGFPERPIELGRGEILFEGGSVMLLAYGSMVEHAIAAREILRDEGIEVGVANARFAKPIDRELVRHAIGRYRWVMTIEEHSVVGGFGSAVLEAANEMGLDTRGVRLVGVPDRFLPHGDREKLMEVLGIDAAGIAARVRTLLGVRARSADAARAR